jgi:hypothetical protein
MWLLVPLLADSSLDACPGRGHPNHASEIGTEIYAFVLTLSVFTGILLPVIQDGGTSRDGVLKAARHELRNWTSRRSPSQCSVPAGVHLLRLTGTNNQSRRLRKYR